MLKEQGDVKELGSVVKLEKFLCWCFMADGQPDTFRAKQLGVNGDTRKHKGKEKRDRKTKEEINRQRKGRKERGSITLVVPSPRVFGLSDHISWPFTSSVWFE